MLNGKDLMMKNSLFASLVAFAVFGLLNAGCEELIKGGKAGPSKSASSQEHSMQLDQQTGDMTDDQSGAEGAVSEHDANTMPSDSNSEMQETSDESSEDAAASGSETL